MLNNKRKLQPMILRAADLGETFTSEFGAVNPQKMFTTIPFKRPYYVQLDQGGVIPPFERNPTQNIAGDFMLSINLEDEFESRGMLTFQSNISKVAQCTKSECFSSFKDANDSMHAFVKDERPNDKGGYWPRVCTAKIVTDKDKDMTCICESDGTEITDLETLRGRRWSTIIFNVRGVYLQGSKAWGIIRSIAKLRLAEDVSQCSNTDLEFVAVPTTPTVATFVSDAEVLSKEETKQPHETSDVKIASKEETEQPHETADDETVIPQLIVPTETSPIIKELSHKRKGASSQRDEPNAKRMK